MSAKHPQGGNGDGLSERDDGEEDRKCVAKPMSNNVMNINLQILYILFS